MSSVALEGVLCSQKITWVILINKLTLMEQKTFLYALWEV